MTVHDKQYHYNHYNRMLKHKSFSDLKGTDLKHAIKYMKNNHPELKTVPIKIGSMKTKDYRSDRVWLEYDDFNKIITIPITG